jgi:hypothetical protein
VTARKRTRKPKDPIPTEKFEIRSEAGWDVVVGNDRQPGEAQLQPAHLQPAHLQLAQLQPDPPQPPETTDQSANQVGGWLNSPAAAPAAEAILASLTKRVQKLEEAVARIEAFLSGPR